MSTVILTYAFDIEGIKSHSKTSTGGRCGEAVRLYTYSSFRREYRNDRRSFTMEFEEQLFWQWVQIDSWDLHEGVLNCAVKNHLQEGNAVRDPFPPSSMISWGHMARRLYTIG